MTDDVLRRAADEAVAPEQASSRLKSRIYSGLVAAAQDAGPLRTLSESKADGEKLCVFEHAVAALPSTGLQSRNPCVVCHARLLAERVERAPIYWPGCPYARFCGH